MKKEEKEQIAVFRFGVIQEFVGGAFLSKEEKKALLGEKCARKWVIPFSGRTRISKNTIYRWVRRYKKSGGRIESLFPGERNDQGKSRKSDPETIAVILQARRERPDLAVPVLVQELKARGQVPFGTSISTVYRLLKGHDLMHPRRTPEDRRKYEASMPNEIWQSDVMHGPKVMVGKKMRKTYLIAFLDDHSRLIPNSGFYLSENLASFMDAFSTALSKRGLPGKLYTDNGSAYRSHRLEFTCASLGIALIHARPYKPQGKGKIERFFRTVRTSFLPIADASSLEALNRCFSDWVEAYHQKKHSATGTTPFDRYTRHLECIRPAPGNLLDHFRNSVYRTVAKDRTITLNPHFSQNF